jgi:fluoroquinolone resistance protein
MKPGSFHESKTFSGLDLRESGLQNVELLDCTVADCQLGEATLERCSFDDVVFKSCDLSVIKLGGSSFQSVRFVECKLTGIDWSRAHDLMFDVSFEDCVLDFSSFVGLPLKGLRIDGGKAHNAVFADSNLQKVRFSHVDLAGTMFTGNDLREGDLSTCANVVLEPNTNRFHKTKLPVDAALRHLKQLGILVPGVK